MAVTSGQTQALSPPCPLSHSTLLSQLLGPGVVVRNGFQHSQAWRGLEDWVTHGHCTERHALK